MLQNLPFSDSIDQTIQLRPQKVRINLRAGNSASVRVIFKQANDYPMDLYYLMDISCTMLKHKTSVSRVGRKLADKIQATTKDFRIGFGSYVDKETIPFSNYKFNSNIKCNKQQMVDTYSFISHMSLDSNTSQFEQQVQSAKISGNLDSPEGTLDALMQVMVCREEIGWRENSDKIIVVATDEEFHYAGDGKLGGILIPNNGKCQLFGNRYLKSRIYDYPSMYHIAELAQLKKFHIIFTVSDQVTQQYQTLSDVIGSNARVASLKVNDETIAELIDEVYRNISNQIELGIEDNPDHIDIEIWTNCGNAKGPFIRTSKCSFVGKPKIEFEIKIKLKHCPQSNSSSIARIGLLNKNEAVSIEIDPICQCACEIFDFETNSSKCSFNGTFSCGICTKCNGIRSGKNCECDPLKPIDSRKPDFHCRPDSDSRPCKGHGQCVCGQCVCDEMFAGIFCQEDQSACFRNGVKCSNHGQCVQSRCVCDGTFTGRFCECPLQNDTCLTNNPNGQLCNGRGECQCGRCKCLVPTSIGSHCQHCPQCDQQFHCRLLRSCVPQFREQFCLTHFDPISNTSIEHDCDFDLCNTKIWHHLFEFKEIEKIDRNKKFNNGSFEIAPETTWYKAQCSQIIDGCVLAFDYRLIKPNNWNDTYLSTKDDNSDLFELEFVLKNITKSCPIRFNATQIASGSFLTVLILGLISILIFKCVTNYLDRKEYERFKKEIAEANFALLENPLYKEVTSQFKNPVFGLRDRASKFFFQ
ncbi:Integrin beta-1 [Sarcoptes scabiei]|uniref:Integrin beta n=1 Tax=Sarcoptes scabiei TaxID=52283 RepID=A0A834RE68_SARSC|nr:Integrin beta-1 [Sarcoptes scabiei]